MHPPIFFSYDPLANPPNYGTPDPIILKQTDEIHKDAEKWKAKANELEEQRLEAKKISHAYVCDSIQVCYISDKFLWYICVPLIVRVSGNIHKLNVFQVYG